MILQIGPKRVMVNSFAEASRSYVSERDNGTIGAWAHGFRENRMPSGLVLADNGTELARVSYNGRVWPAGEWKPGMMPLFDNRVAA